MVVERRPLSFCSDWKQSIHDNVYEVNEIKGKVWAKTHQREWGHMLFLVPSTGETVSFYTSPQLAATGLLCVRCASPYLSSLGGRLATFDPDHFVEC